MVAIVLLIMNTLCSNSSSVSLPSFLVPNPLVPFSPSHVSSPSAFSLRQLTSFSGHGQGQASSTRAQDPL
jgi:hypothetical protein